MVSPLHHITSVQEYCKDRVCNPLCFWCISMTLLMVPFQDADDTTAYSSIQTSDVFDKLEMTAEMEKELRFIVELGEN